MSTQITTQSINLGELIGLMITVLLITSLLTVMRSIFEKTHGE